MKIKFLYNFAGRAAGKVEDVDAVEALELIESGAVEAIEIRPLPIEPIELKPRPGVKIEDVLADLKAEKIVSVLAPKPINSSKGRPKKQPELRAHRE